MALEVEMRWSAAHGDDQDWFQPIVKDTISLLGAWAGIKGNAVAAVELATSAYFDDEAEWSEQFGTEETFVAVQVEVHGPPAIAGRYAVDLHRKVTATAKPVE